MFYSDLENFKATNGYEIDGIWYPRVTAILSIKSKPMLYRYYADAPNYKTAQAMTARSAEEGTLVHNTIEAILKKELLKIPETIQPSIEAFMTFIKNNEVNPLKIEERIISKNHHYAGTIDILAEVNGQVGVLDIKTSKAVYRDYGMQTAAYVEAFKEDPTLPPLASWILRIDQARKCSMCRASMREKGGNVKITGNKNCPHEWSEMQGEYEFKTVDGFDHNIKAFLAAKTLWEWEHHDWLSKIK